MNNIRRNTDPMKGPPDGVAADIQCAVTQYDTPKGKGKNARQRTIKGQGVMPCTVFCSYQDGTVGLSIREIDLQIDIRVDELMALMQAGAEAAQELNGPQNEQYTDEILEEKWRDLQKVLWVDADSPSGWITGVSWWIFPRGVDRDDLWAWFGERHSLGIEYLHELID